MTKKNFFFIVGIPPLLVAPFEKKLLKFKGNYREFTIIPIDEYNSYNNHKIVELYSQIRAFLLQFENKNGPYGFQEEFRGIGLIAFTKSANEKTLFQSTFSPEILVTTEQFPKDWYTVRKNNNNSVANTHFITLKNASKRLQTAINFIYSRINSGANSTPLLLPTHNFDETELTVLSEKIFAAANMSDPISKIEDAITNFDQKFPKKLTKVHSNRRIYVNSNGLNFMPPSALHGHPVSRLKNHHEPNCWVRGMLRFGAPFNPKFHYDCTKKNLKRDWRSCHFQNYSIPNEKNHVNIAPNDAIR